VYRKVDPDGTAPESFEFPHGGKLASDNRWVTMAQLIPWSEFEAEYAQNLASSMGAPAKSFRMALGALIIKEKLGTSARARGRTNTGKPIPAILYRFLILQ
jgi:transposase, IS5 family